ncbi:microsomal triacylglycerol transfer protein [Amyelois transitella]|uniref:microsomal triacylglycerol transfer protein n=1 Tax=Amyelois transitella TaxID=680683 RepID=UPI00298FA4F9|nr:microsomal triacylglycerol transfer protein [Amyelois transitella]
MFLYKSYSSQHLIRLFIYLFIFPLYLASTSSVPREYGEFKLFQTPVLYDLNTSVSINDELESGRSIGYRIKAVVRVEPVWSSQETDFLLKFHLESPQLYTAGKKGEVSAASSWGSLGESAFYARLTHGIVQTAYLDDKDPVDLLNYKKSIISLFQFRAIDGESKETDVSGPCDVLYESSSLTTIYKTKTKCEWEEAGQWRRRATYSLSAALDALAGVRARETAALGSPRALLLLRAEHSLALRAAHARPAPAPAPAELHQALQAIPPHLKPDDLTLKAEPQKWEWDEELEPALSELLSLAGAGGEEAAGAGGGERGAGAALRALPALAAAPAAAVRRVLEDDRYYDLLPTLYRLVGLSGSAAGLSAAIQHLQLLHEDAPRQPALQLLAGAALAGPAAGADALLQLAREARAPHVADAALLAAAARARHQPQQREVRDHLLKDLARCKEDPCRITRLHALGNLAAPEAAAALAAQLERGAPGVALAALDALEALPAAALPDSVQRVAAAGGRALEVRAAALDLLLRRRPAALLALAPQLRAAPPELRRVLWQRVAASAELRALLPGLPLRDRSWLARANPGTSHVLQRATGWARGAALHSTQLAAAGALRRGTVALFDAGHELLAVEVWARGLESLAGADAAPLGEGAHAAAAPHAGLRTRLRHTHQPGLLLFSGQAELLGHVWAGAGSEPTPVLRGAALGDRSLLRTARAPLVTGAVLHHRALHLDSFAVDAQAQVSLWSRSARATLELRVASLSDCRAGVAAVGGAGPLLAAARAGAAPSLTLDAHMDFYDGVTLCVRADLAAHAETANHTLAARRRRTLRRAGRTLALGRDNDGACRHLAAADRR